MHAESSTIQKDGRGSEGMWFWTVIASVVVVLLVVAIGKLSRK